jgi:hypothetical protein
MSVLEQVAFGWQCLLAALRACGSRAVWGPWAALFVLQALGLLVLAWCAHPALSWAMAPLLRAIEGDAVLRYPELYRRLPALARDTGLVLAAFVTPVAAGISAALFERHFRREPGPALVAWADGGSRAGALLLAGLPVTLAMLGLYGMLHALPHVRLSSAARAAAPLAAGAALAFVRTVFAYAPALVVLGRRSAPAALATVPATWAPGFVPAGTALLLLAPLTVAATIAAAASASLVERGAPEWGAAVVLARAAVDTFVSMVASGAVTLAWLGVIDRPVGRS